MSDTPPKMGDKVVFTETLKLLGAESVERSPLILPVSFRDYTKVSTSFHASFAEHESTEQDQQAGIDLSLFSVKIGDVLHDDPKNPFIIVSLKNDYGESVPGVFFSSKRMIRRLSGSDEKIYVAGQPSIFDEHLILDECELVSPEHIGQIIPIYKGVRNKRERDLVHALIRYAFNHHSDELQQLCAQIEQQIIQGGYEIDILLQAYFGCSYHLYDLLNMSHFPPSIEMAKFALNSLELINHIHAAVMVKEKTKATEGTEYASKVDWNVFDYALSKMPYRLTDEQREAARRLLELCSLNKQGQAILSADVGMGKTSVFGVAAYTLSRSGKEQRVAIMAPNSILVKQIAADLSGWFPDLRVEILLGGTQSVPDGIEEADIIVSTTSLLSLSKKTGMRYALSIVDEEQKMGARQRELLATYSQNYLASTATLVPRTMQLAQLQSYEVLRLTKSHVKKTIHTKIIDSNGLVSEALPLAQRLIEEGHQIIVIYPAATEKNVQKNTDRPNDPEIVQHLKERLNRKKRSGFDRASAEAGAAQLEAFFPGKVGFVHGGMKEEEKADILFRMLKGELSVLVGTTILEAGITIPKVRMAIVMESENFGLSNLHQIRGRVARPGGEGWFFLHTDTESDKSFARLEVLEKETDGYKIAERDLLLRGFGDLRRFAKDQSGEVMRGFLPNSAIKVRIMRKALSIFVGGTDEADAVIHYTRRRIASSK